MKPFHYRDCQMCCEDIPLAQIAAEVGTPVYVYSTAALIDQVRLIDGALDELGDPLVAFAVKANPNPAILSVLAEEGLGADIVSIGEYRRARAAGVDPQKILFSGVGKDRAEMEEALAGGLLQFNLESVEEAKTLSEVATQLGKAASVAFRINPDVDAGTHAKISTGTIRNKFGIPVSNALNAYRATRDLPGLNITGITVHIGSQLTTLAPLETAFEKLGEIIAALKDDGFELQLADLGGGLGISYGSGQPIPPTPAEYAAMVARVTNQWGLRLAFEPGRLIAGNAGVLLSRVIRVKGGDPNPWIIVDAAMNDLMRPALYDAYHQIDSVTPSAQRITANIVGPICESGDVFALAREIDQVAEGELLIFRTAGAYGAAMSNTYNSRPLTPEVLVDGNRWALVRKRIDLGEVAADQLPQWIAAAG
jgi:diaminopimelate decarboxylase